LRRNKAADGGFWRFAGASGGEKAVFLPRQSKKLFIAE
jgi:hypothetical protein